jgi:hypothetical protein
MAVVEDSDSIVAAMGYFGTSRLVVLVDDTAEAVVVGTMFGTLEEEWMVRAGRTSDVKVVVVTEREHSIPEDTVGTEERIGM